MEKVLYDPRSDKEWSSLRPVWFIHPKPFLNIDLRKQLYTAGSLDISEVVDAMHDIHIRV